MHRSFIQPDDLFMLLEEFALPPTIVQSAIRRLFIQPDDPFMLLEEFALPPIVV